MRGKINHRLRRKFRPARWEFTDIRTLKPNPRSDSDLFCAPFQVNAASGHNHQTFDISVQITENVSNKNMQLTPTIGCAQCRTARAATLFRILACFALLRLATGHDPAPSSAPPVTDDVSTLAQMRRPSMYTSLPPIYGVHTQSIQDMILQYVDETLNRRTFELLAGLTLIEKNRTQTLAEQSDAAVAQQSARQASPAAAPFDVQLLDRLTRFAETHVINLSVPRAVQATAKTFFFKSKARAIFGVHERFDA